MCLFGGQAFNYGVEPLAQLGLGMIFFPYEDHRALSDLACSFDDGFGLWI